MGRLIHQAIPGAANQRPRIGSARGQGVDCSETSKHPLSRATTGAIHMVV